MANIEAVIFDLGRVMVGIHTTGEKFAGLMRAVGVVPDEAFATFWNAPEVIQHTTGAIDSREFYALVQRRTGLGLSYDDFAAAWCDIFRPMPDMEDLFRRVSETRTVGILSDTDPLHWSRILQMIPALTKVERPTLSFDVGRTKPHPDIYRAAAANCGVGAERCLFIDDVEANVEGARASGMSAIRFTGIDDLRDRLGDLGILTPIN